MHNYDVNALSARAEACQKTLRIYYDNISMTTLICLMYAIASFRKTSLHVNGDVCGLSQ